MVIARDATKYICTSCLHRHLAYRSPIFKHVTISKASITATAWPRENRQAFAKPEERSKIPDKANGDEEGHGGMSRRLAQMTDETIEQSGRNARKAFAEGGFSEELKKRLEERIQETSFKSDNSAAFAQVTMPSSAGEGTRDTAAAQPWSGNEKLEDAALRMLDDAHKPIRGTRPFTIPSVRGTPVTVDLRMKKATQKSQGERLANARDRMSVYSLSQDPNLSESEREQMRKTLKERFTAGARPMPGSVQGLAALANERIEDAIARGQFRNIPRGKGTNVERDYNANSPFLDTTEYFMNKIIQKQEIVPPWIEKQQELVKATAVFRGRIRSDWKRHAARVIASKGGSLEAQIKRAEAYAAAEAFNNPKNIKTESMTEIDHEGKLSQLTVTETPTPASNTSDSKIAVTEGLALDSPALLGSQDGSKFTTSPPQTKSEDFQVVSRPLPLPPFRDPAWERLEFAYHSLAIKELNNLTRTYNLQAPDLAKKPYFSLDRELRSCFADIAPQLPHEIRERARRPERVRVEVVGHRPGGMLHKFSTDRVKVHDSTKPNYGFKHFWKDLWGV